MDIERKGVSAKWLSKSGRYKKQQNVLERCLPKKTSRQACITLRSGSLTEDIKSPDVNGNELYVFSEPLSSECTIGSMMGLGHAHGTQRDVQCRHRGRTPSHLVFLLRLAKYGISNVVCCESSLQHGWDRAHGLPSYASQWSPATPMQALIVHGSK
ncbi:hypothetical protein QQS21_007997 [Conoideocrella luteorostrata]|uniref:Uncharacterized protein n=1 Tax=Conoideocrella luteorostrata TaxID=1105319 RepID=A0AAJ0CP30_9HYPO|nr:hypothetical protein QQS21_007997 [Conoideocrella luteorostrata]